MFKTVALGAALTTMGAVAAHATTIGATLLPPATSTGFTLVDLGNSGTTGFVTGATQTVGGETITFGAQTGTYAAGVYHGSVANVSKSPFSGTGLQDVNYLTAEPGADVTIKFSSPQTAFNLLWGSIDQYNHLSFEFNNGVDITGNDIAAAVSGVNFGTSNAAVSISDLIAFSTVTIHTTGIAFEFVPGTEQPGTPVPEPATLALLGAGLAGIGMVRRARRG